MAEAKRRIGTMDVTPNREMWKNFKRLMMATVGVTALTLILLAIFVL
jgi:hypothetical protein